MEGFFEEVMGGSFLKLGGGEGGGKPKIWGINFLWGSLLEFSIYKIFDTYLKNWAFYERNLFCIFSLGPPLPTFYGSVLHKVISFQIQFGFIISHVIGKDFLKTR